MRRTIRDLSLVVALFSFESAVLAAREPCPMGAGDAPATIVGSESAMDSGTKRGSHDDEGAHGVHEVTPSSHGHGDHAPTRGHTDAVCVLALTCASAVLPAVHSPAPTVIAAGFNAPSAVPALAPGRRPAPDVPPPRA
ncbi:MAG: hypothetical protein OEW77_04845 [Gemmatimonadota bacterium]|nr:hypothetical protein [Gemmatimonadota bacterium]